LLIELTRDLSIVYFFIANRLHKQLRDIMSRDRGNLSSESEKLRANAATLKQVLLEKKEEDKSRLKDAKYNIKHGLASTGKGIAGLFGKRKKKEPVIENSADELLDIGEPNDSDYEDKIWPTRKRTSSKWTFFLASSSCCGGQEDEERLLVINAEPPNKPLR
jgi:hypothetical protein